jgi:argininosuccinate lyase
VLKGLPLAYNKDLQEDKEALFDAVDTVKKCLLVFAPLLKTTKFKAERMREGAGRGFTNATDLADYLVRRGLPFRSAHEVVGRLVLYCTRNHKTLEELSLAELNRESGSRPLKPTDSAKSAVKPAARTQKTVGLSRESMRLSVWKPV